MPQFTKEQPGPGRPKGSKNKCSAALAEQILASLDARGGLAYLNSLPDNLFMMLLGKVVPREGVVQHLITWEDVVKAYTKQKDAP